MGCMHPPKFIKWAPVSPSSYSTRSVHTYIAGVGQGPPSPLAVIRFEPATSKTGTDYQRVRVPFQQAQHRCIGCAPLGVSLLQQGARADCPARPQLQCQRLPPAAPAARTRNCPRSVCKCAELSAGWLTATVHCCACTLCFNRLGLHAQECYCSRKNPRSLLDSAAGPGYIHVGAGHIPTVAL